MPSSQRGFSLIEALIAMSVLLLAVLGMLSVVPFGFNGAQTNSIQVQAVAVAQQYLEDERTALLQGSSVAMPTATSAPIDPGQKFLLNGTTSASYGSFSVAPDGCTTAPFSNPNGTVYSCSVTVSWVQNGATRSLTVQSYVTK